MIELNLNAINKAQERIKEYLQNNVSEILAQKINNGVEITKDNKTLINKKDLDGFMKYANDEAKKQAEKGANFACIDDDTVFGWAIHYFEENEIIGTLYNLDGTLYQEQRKEIPKETKTESKKENKQISFDLFNLSNNQEIAKTNAEKQEKNEKIDEKTENLINSDTFDKFQLETIFNLLDEKVVIK